ncbi:late promoters transcription protein [Pectobacterium phage POP12]|nr:late promoters transcription protein [Pectobacterium phage POP12]
MEVSNKTEVGLIIEGLVNSENLSYMESTVQWMDENNIEYHMLNKFVPRAIIDKIRAEAIENDMIRPSMRVNKKLDLESLCEIQDAV